MDAPLTILGGQIDTLLKPVNTGRDAADRDHLIAPAGLSRKVRSTWIRLGPARPPYQAFKVIPLPYQWLSPNSRIFAIDPEASFRAMAGRHLECYDPG